MPAYFWRQRVSGASGFLVAAHFWWQPTSGVNLFLMSIHYSCECIAGVNTIFPLLMSIHLLMLTQVLRAHGVFRFGADADTVICP
jgi:hypothetical protein